MIGNFYSKTGIDDAHVQPINDIILVTNQIVVGITNGAVVVVRLLADTTERNVVAQGVVDGETVASASAADNVGTIISTATQSFTFPVRKGSKWKVDSTFGSSKVEVRWFTFGISL